MCMCIYLHTYIHTSIIINLPVVLVKTAIRLHFLNTYLTVSIDLGQCFDNLL